MQARETPCRHLSSNLRVTDSSSESLDRAHLALRSSSAFWTEYFKLSVTSLTGGQRAQTLPPKMLAEGSFEWSGRQSVFSTASYWGQPGYHKRASSRSALSITSEGPPSSLSKTTIYPPQYEDTQRSAQLAESLHTPSTGGHIYPRLYRVCKMRRAQSPGEDENAPATPHTNDDVDNDDEKNIFNGTLEA